MIDCEKCRERMIEALYGELGEDDEASFDAHLDSCASCAAEFKAMTATLELLDKRERPDPGPAFWDGYWDRLSKRLDKEMSPAPSRTSGPRTSCRDLQRLPEMGLSIGRRSRPRRRRHPHRKDRSFASGPSGPAGPAASRPHGPRRPASLGARPQGP